MSGNPQSVAYKESGIPWVGKIPEHWEMRKIKYIFCETSIKNCGDKQQLASTQQYGVIPKTLYPFRTVEAVSSDLNTFKFVEKDNFVISLRSFEGGIEHSEYEGIISPAYTILKAKDFVEPLYLKFLLKSSSFISALQLYKTGIREGQNISYTELQQDFLPLPPLEEQKKIADFLDKKTHQIEEFITKKQKLIALLEEKKQTLINQCVTQGLDSPTSLKDSGVEWLGKIPTHWEMTKIKHFCEINPQTNQEIPNHFTYIDLESVTKGVLWKKQVISKEQAPSRAQRILQKKDILFQLVRPYQKNNYLFDEDGDYVASTGYAQVRTREYAKFIYYAFLEDSLIQRIALKCTGSNYPAITSSDFGDLKIPLPPLEEQKAIAEYLDTQIEKIDLAICKIKSQINLIKEYKSTLISEAVCGRIGI